MTYRFIYGRTGSGKSRYCYNEIVKRYQQKDCMLIVPEQFSFQSEMELLKLGGEKAMANVLVCSFKRLTFWVKNKYGIINEKQLNKAGKNLIICDILNRQKNNLNIYGNVNDSTSFISGISSLLSEFKRYGVTDKKISEVLSDMDKDGNTYKKITDIGLIYDEYQKAVDGFTDPDDNLYWLSEKIEQDNLFSGYEIWIDGFDGFTPCEYAVIKQLLKTSERVSFTACTDRVLDDYVVTGELFYPIIKTCNKIVQIAEENNICYDKSVKLTESYKYSNSEMKFLESNIFSSSSKTYENNVENITLNIYKNIYEEINEVANKITGLVRDGKLKYGDIMVICPNADDYESYIRSIFSQYHIPYFMDMKKTIENNPLIIFIQTLLKIHINNYRSDDIFRLLKTGLTDIEPSQIDLLENYVLKFGINGKLWDPDVKWDFLRELKDNDELYDENEINEIKNTVISNIKQLFEKIGGECEAKTFFSNLYNFLTENKITDKYKEIVLKFKQEGKLESVNHYISTYNSFINLIDTAVKLLKGTKFKLSEFAVYIEAGVLGYESGSVPPALEQVNVGNISRSMAREVKAVFILGVNEGKFPGINLEEGLLSDMDRELLKKNDVELAPDTITRTFETKYLTYKTLCIPSDKLYLSCPSMDMKGGTLRPAYIFTLIKKLYEKMTVTGDVTGTNKRFFDVLGTPESTFKELVKDMDQKREGTLSDKRWNLVHKWYQDNEKWSDRIRLIYKAYKLTYDFKKINSKVASELFGNPLTGSVSSFELYNNCPFAYFIRYGLKLKEREKAELNPLGIGSVSHYVLEIIFNKIKEKGIKFTDITQDYIDSAVKDEIIKAASMVWGKSILSSNRNEYLIKRYGNTVALTVKTLIKHITEGKFNPVDDELTFGKNGIFDAVKVKTDNMSAVISGKIDRLDAYKNQNDSYIRVIDYKTGKKKFSLEDFYYGLQIQLPVYLHAIMKNEKYIQNLYDTNNVIPGGIFYYNIDNPIIKTNYNTDNEEILKQINKQLMLKGLALENEDVIKAMDTKFQGKSDIINVKRNKNGSFSKRSDIASSEEFDMIIKYTDRMLKNTVNDISNGIIHSLPVYKGLYTGCDYCSYKAICGFDTSIKGCKYKVVKSKLKDKEIWKLIKDKIDEER